jgi:hypothetical protein
MQTGNLPAPSCQVIDEIKNLRFAEDPRLTAIPFWAVKHIIPGIATLSEAMNNNKLVRWLSHPLDLKHYNE